MDDISIAVSPTRKMGRAELLGRHTHATTSGISVHIYERTGKLLARGRYAGRAFGETLGAPGVAAEAKLRQLLIDIENGDFIPPKERGKRPIPTKTPSNLSVVSIADRFLTEKRSTHGKQTMQTYRSRMAPILAFCDQPEIRRRYRYARDIDHTFAVELKSFLMNHSVTPNGRPGAQSRRMSIRQVHNALGCFRSMLAWAVSPVISLLPASFITPMSREIVGSKPTKDPLREVKLPIHERIELVAGMDCWQLASIGIALVLPLRPEELAGLLVTDFDVNRQDLKIGSRFGDNDFTKGHQSFRMPLPKELAELIRNCIGDRTEGPLLLGRRFYDGSATPKRPLFSSEDLRRQLEEALEKAGPNEIQTQQDRKRVVRKVLQEMGGVSTSELAREFKKLVRRIQPGVERRLYDLRHAVSTEMNRSEMRLLELRYLTGHATKDIMNVYVGLEPHREMNKYYEFARPLLNSLIRRALELSCIPDRLAA